MASSTAPVVMIDTPTTISLANVNPVLNTVPNANACSKDAPRSVVLLVTLAISATPPNQAATNAFQKVVGY